MERIRALFKINWFKAIHILITMIKINIKNIIAYGWKAPKYREQIWIDPSAVQDRLTQEKRKLFFGCIYPDSGSIIGGDWDNQGIPVESLSTFKACYEHWIMGISWEQTGRYERMLNHIRKKGEPLSGCTTIEDIVARYKRVDQIFETIKAEQRFRSCRDHDRIRGFFRDSDMVIFIDRHGRPMHGGNGNHRIAIAKILHLPVIPARLGVVHPLGLKYLDSYRKKPQYKTDDTR